jgi:hypothetical protein
MVMLTVLLLGGKAFSQNVDDIISKHLDAMGGQDKLAALTSLYEEVDNSIAGNSLPTKVWIGNNLGYRMEMDIMGSKMEVVVNKEKGWQINPMTGNSDPQPFPDEAVKESASRMVLGSPFVHYKDRGYTATLAGTEKVNGKDTYKIKLSKAGLSDGYYDIDQSTYFIDKDSVSSFANGAMTTVDIIFGSYAKSPEGVSYASSFSMNLPQGDLESTVTKAVFNQPVDPKLFQNP